MAKLSTQFLKDAPQERATRSQRVAFKQKAIRDIKNFKELQNQAKNLQEGEFSKLASIEEYEQKYNLLDPKLKQFFTTPTQLRKQKIERIEDNSTKVANKIIDAKRKLAEKKAYYENEEKRYRSWWNDQSSKSKSSSKESYREDLKELKDDWDENRTYWTHYLQGLNEGLGKLKGGKDVSFGDINKYADELGDYYESREDARNDRNMKEWKQNREIDKLTEQGFNPMLMQDFKNDKLAGEELLFYNPKTHKYADLIIPLNTKASNISNLKKSELGRTEIKRILKIGGEEFSFKTNAQLYVTPTGKLTTQLGGSTALTETEIMKNAKDKAYGEFLEKNQKMLLDPTISNAKIEADNRKWYDKSLQELIIQSTKSKVMEGIKWIRGKAKQGLDVVDDYARWDFQISGTGTILKVSSIDFGKKTEFDEKTQIFDPVQKIENVQTNMGGLAFRIKDKEIERQLGKDIYEDFKISQQDTAKEDVTSLFYRSDVGKTAFFDAKTEDEVTQAFTQYKETDEFKQYETQYKKQYKEELDMMLGDVDYGTKLTGIFAEIKISALGLGSGILSLVKSPARLGLTTGALVGGGAVLGLLATPTLVALDVAFLTGGAIKTFSPSSTMEERGGGAVMMGLAGLSLGIKGISYARQPTVKYTKIKPPKTTLKVTELIGREIGRDISKIIFENQKTFQTSSAGRRTLVSTKWRDFLGLKKVYEGIPYAQKNIVRMTSLRGSYQVSLGKSGYQKAYDLLIKRGGYSPYQAKTTLKYVQPKILEQYLSKGVLNIKGSIGKGEFTYLTKQPVVTLDAGLGIKTRGAKTIKNIYDVERKLINLKDGGAFVLEEKTGVGIFLKKGGTPFALKEIDFSKAILKGKGSELKAGYDPLKIQIKGLKGFKEIQYQDIKGVSIGKKLFPAENIIRIDTQQTKLIKEIIDFTKEKSFVKFTGTKTAFSKTFGYGSDIKITNIKEIIKSTKIAPVSKIDKIINKLDDFGSVKTQSEYYGKGLYERSSGGALPQQIQQPSAQLKAILKQSVAPPDIALKTQIKDLIKVDYASALAFKTGSLTGLAPLSALKQSSELKASLKLDLDINTLGKLKQEIAIKQGTKTKTVQISTTKQINDLISMPVTSSLLSPVFKEPIIQPQMPKIPAFPIWFKTPKRKTKKNKLTKQIQDLLFIPDFTSRSIGLGAETITEKQAQAKLKKILTGLEIRRAIKFK